MNADHRKRGALAAQLDSERLLELGRDAVAAQYPTADLSTLRVEYEPQMLVTIPDPELAKSAVVNREGVGHIQQEDTVAVYFSDGFTAFPIDLPIKEVRACWDLETTIDLADGIRAFGARLEANFHTWHSKATGTY